MEKRGLILDMVNNPSKYEPKPPVITKHQETKTEDIIFQNEEEQDPTALVGVIVVKQEGKNGTRTITTEYTYADGVQISSKIIGDNTISPVTKITVVGTKAPEPDDGEPEPPVVVPDPIVPPEAHVGWLVQLIRAIIKAILSIVGKK